jgi:hypothetical protein
MFTTHYCSWYRGVSVRVMVLNATSNNIVVVSFIGGGNPTLYRIVKTLYVTDHGNIRQ